MSSSKVSDVLCTEIVRLSITLTRIGPIIKFKRVKTKDLPFITIDTRCICLRETIGVSVSPYLWFFKFLITKSPGSWSPIIGIYHVKVYEGFSRFITDHRDRRKTMTRDPEERSSRMVKEGSFHLLSSFLLQINERPLLGSPVRV